MTESTLVYLDDDWRQERAGKVADTPSGKKFLQLASEHRFTPRMADATMKNSIGCAFPFMVMSTNQRDAHDETINFDSATVRRHDFIWHVTRDPGVHAKNDFTLWKFERHHIVYNGVAYVPAKDKRTYTFVEVALLALELARVRHNRWVDASTRAPEMHAAVRENRAAKLKAALDQLVLGDDSTLNEMFAGRAQPVPPATYAESYHDASEDDDDSSSEVSDEHLFEPSDDGVPDDPGPSSRPSFMATVRAKVQHMRRPHGPTIGEYRRSRANVVSQAGDGDPAPGSVDAAAFRSRNAGLFAAGLLEERAARTLREALGGRSLPDSLERVEKYILGDEFEHYENMTEVRKHLRRRLLHGATTHEAVWAAYYGACNDFGYVVSKFSELGYTLKQISVNAFSILLARVPLETLGITFPAFDMGNAADFDPLNLVAGFQNAVAAAYRAFSDWAVTPLGSMIISVTVIPLVVPIFVSLGFKLMSAAGLGPPGMTPNRVVHRRAQGAGEDPTPQSAPPAKYVGKKKPGFGTVSNDQVHKFLAGGAPVAQAGMSSPEIQDLFAANMWGVTITDAVGKPVSLGFTTFISGRLGLMPHHFLLWAAWAAMRRGDADPAFIFTRGDLAVTAPLAKIRMLFSKLEVLYFEFQDPTFPMARSIVKHVAPKSAVDLSLFAAHRSFAGVLVSPTFYGAFNYGVGTENLHVTDIDVTLDYALTYPIGTQPGHCGALLVLTSGAHAGTIAGIHVAGNNVDLGFAQPLYRELFAASELKEPVPEAVAVSEELAIEVTEAVSQGTRDFHGDARATYITRSFPLPATVHQRNYIVPFRGDGPEHVPRKLAATSVAPHVFTKVRGLFPVVDDHADDAYYRRIGVELSRRLRSFALDVKMVNLSIEDSVVGIESTALKSLDAHSSTGHPDSALGITRNQYYSFSATGGLVREHRWPELVDRVRMLVKVAAAGGCFITVFKDIVKGEKRSIAKVAEDKSRLVNGAELAFTIVCTMYFGAASLVLKDGAPRNGILIGVASRNAAQWNAVARLLRQVGRGAHVGSGDYRGFDQHMSASACGMAYDVMSSWYPEDDLVGNQVRRAIKHVALNTYHIFGSVIERRTDTNPSGIRLTTEVNCVINLGNFLSAWVQLHGGDFTTMPKFWNHVSLMVLGDDNVFSVSDQYKDRFTEAYVAKALRFHGQEYSAPDKGPARESLSELSNHAILKRGFRFEPAVQSYVGPLDLDVVLELPMWTKAGSVGLRIAKDNMRESLMELSVHGEDVFNHWLPRLRKFFGRHWEPESEDWAWYFSRATT